MNKFLSFIAVITILCLNSCLVSKKVVYFKDMDVDSVYKVLPVPPLKIQKNDRLSINVSSRNPELSVPFNSTGGVYTMSDNGQPVSAFTEKGYLVDQFGNIDFPILGTMNVEGMTLDGLRDFLVDRLKTENLINNAVIKVELLNLKVIMVGETRNQIINAPDGRLTLLEAIAKGQGLGMNGSTDKIKVIREENGLRKVYYNNIESKDIFNSPTFYLQQNDIIYIEPMMSTRRGDEARTWRLWSMATGLLSLGVTTWALIVKN